MSLKKSADTIHQADQRAQARRVMWSSLDDRIDSEFQEIIKYHEACSILGNLYISKGEDAEPSRSSGLSSSQLVNSTHIFTGQRLLGLFTLDAQKKILKPATERTAQLWYSQSPSGNVFEKRVKSALESYG